MGVRGGTDPWRGGMVGAMIAVSECWMVSKGVMVGEVTVVRWYR